MNFGDSTAQHIQYSEGAPDTVEPNLNMNISSTSLGISQAALSISNTYLFMSMNATTTNVSFTALKISLISLDISIRALEFSIFSNSMAISWCKTVFVGAITVACQTSSESSQLASGV